MTPTFNLILSQILYLYSSLLQRYSYLHIISKIFIVQIWGRIICIIKSKVQSLEFLQNILKHQSYNLYYHQDRQANHIVLNCTPEQFVKGKVEVETLWKAPLNTYAIAPFVTPDIMYLCEFCPENTIGLCHTFKVFSFSISILGSRRLLQILLQSLIFSSFMTVILLLANLLRVNLTIIPQMHSHLERLQELNPLTLYQQVGIVYCL